MKFHLQKWKSEIVCLIVVILFFLPLCGYLFRCGCTMLWAGGIAHCNINNPGPPDCPWCSGPLLLQLLPLLLTCLAALGAIRLTRRNRDAQFLRDLAIGLLTAFIAALLIAWAYSKLLHYNQ